MYRIKCQYKKNKYPLLFPLILLFILFIHPLLFSLQKENCKNIKNYIYCFDGYYKLMSGFNSLSGEPQFENEIRKEYLGKLYSYFKKFSYYKKIKKKIISKKAISYEFYHNQKRKNQFYFVYNQKSKKMMLKKAIWYNYKNNFDQIHDYFLTSEDKNNYSHQFYYFNDFGILFKKVQKIYDSFSNQLISTIIDSNFALEENILGKIEY